MTKRGCQRLTQIQHTQSNGRDKIPVNLRSTGPNPSTLVALGTKRRALRQTFTCFIAFGTKYSALRQAFTCFIAFGTKRGALRQAFTCFIAFGTESSALRQTFTDYAKDNIKHSLIRNSENTNNRLNESLPHSGGLVY